VESEHGAQYMIRYVIQKTVQITATVPT